MEKNTIPKEFRKYIDEDLLTVTWENEGEKILKRNNSINTMTKKRYSNFKSFVIN